MPILSFGRHDWGGSIIHCGQCLENIGMSNADLMPVADRRDDVTSKVRAPLRRRESRLPQKNESNTLLWGAIIG